MSGAQQLLIYGATGGQVQIRQIAAVAILFVDVVLDAQGRTWWRTHFVPLETGQQRLSQIPVVLLKSEHTGAASLATPR